MSAHLGCVSVLQAGCYLLFAVAHVTVGQERDLASRVENGAAQHAARATENGDLGQATAILQTDLRLSSGQSMGPVNDLVVDNAGRVLFVIVGIQGEMVAVPFGVLSMERPGGPLILDMAHSSLAGIPRLLNVNQLANRSFQARLMAFFREHARADLTPVRFGPSEIRRGSSILGTEILARDQQVFGVLNDFVIDRRGVVQIVTTTVGGDIVPIPFAALWLDDVAAGQVAVNVPLSVLLEAPRTTDVSSIDESLRNQVSGFFEGAKNRTREAMEKQREARSLQSALRFDDKPEDAASRISGSGRDQASLTDDRARSFAIDSALRSRTDSSRALVPSQDRQQPVLEIREGSAAIDQPDPDNSNNQSADDTTMRDATRSYRDDRARRSGVRTQPGMERSNDRMRAVPQLPRQPRGRNTPQADPPRAKPPQSRPPQVRPNG
jgi:hypothetical protein